MSKKQKRTYTGYTKDLLEPIIKDSKSWAEVIRKLGKKPGGGTQSNLIKRCDEFNIDYSHFTGKGWNKLGHTDFGNRGLPLDKYFIKGPKKASSKVKQRIINHKLKKYECENCGIKHKNGWLNKNIVIELHHINGDTTDNRLNNLQLLCPNCHSQTNTYCKRKSLL